MSGAAKAVDPVGKRAVGAIRILVKAFDDLTDAGQVQVPAEHAEVFTWIFGWWAWITRNSKLVLLAHEADLAHESSPNVRSILEHSLVMQWVADVGAEALATLTALDSEWRRKFINELNAAGWSVPADVTPPPPLSKPLKFKGKVTNFNELCVSYDARSLYIPYRMLSTHVHPTARGALAYIGDEGQLANYPVHDDSDSDLVLVAVCVIQAALTIDSLLDNEVLTTAIAAARERLGAAIDRPQLGGPG